MKIFFLIFLGWSNCISALQNQEIEPDILRNGKRFSTWQGIEPDKWATLWMIKRYIAKDAYFFLVPPNSPLPENTIAFDVPNASIRRTNKQAMFSQLKQTMELNNNELEYLDKIIHDVEVNIWDKPKHPHSSWFETMYRNLQERYQRDQVPIDCYLIFFDKVAQLANQPNISALDYENKLSLTDECPGIKKYTEQESVGRIGHMDILREISLGKKIVFIDTREDQEYNEIHLPEAKILKLRDVNIETIKAYSHADLIVPYCVKDFRGFEVAKAMKQLGLKNVATLSPNGLKGWIDSGLPLVTTNGLTEKQAHEALVKCATEPQVCL